MKPIPAALYVRSSNDEADGNSTGSQKRELKKWAAEKGYSVVATFEDRVASGSNDETLRPGLKSLLDAAKTKQWKTLIVLEPSRLARRPEIIAYVESQLAKTGIQIVFKSLPMDPASAMTELVRTVVSGIDRLHSRLSREKGLAGMKENILNGWRAGGRPPTGYLREVVPTGAVRNGTPVTKSRLVPDPAMAPIVAAFLKARASGEARIIAKQKSGIPLAAPSLVSLERNAMVYAGYTTWNRRSFTAPSRDDPHTRSKMNPTTEVVVSPKPTHEPLITLDEARKIMALPIQRQRRVDAREETLLGGILTDEAGNRWQLYEGGRTYRAPNKGRRLDRRWFDEQVLMQVARDAKSEDFIAEAVNSVRAAAAALEVHPEPLRDALAETEMKIGRIVDAIAEGSSVSLAGKLRELESRKAEIESQLAAINANLALKTELGRWSAAHVSAWFDFALASDAPMEEVRRFLRAVVESVVVTREGAIEIRYRIPIGLRKLASPRGFEPRSQP